MSFSGFDNEDFIIEVLNGKTFQELNTNLKQLIKYIFKNYEVGTKVNIETDMFARYIEHLLANRGKKNLSWDEVDNMNMSY